VKIGPLYKIVRVKGAGFESVDIDPELAPSADVAFGSDRGEPIAWLHDTSLVVWLTGERPRVIASIGTSATRTLGEPTSAGVPVVLSATDWSLFHMFPIPPIAKSPKSAPSIIPPPALTGWTPVPNVRRDAGRFAVCAKGGAAKGPRFHVMSTAKLAASIDTLDEEARAAAYTLRISGGDACVDAMAVAFPEAKPRAPVHSSKKSIKGPVGFVRADLLGKKADGGDRSPPPADLRKLTCTLAPH
jgi:hypothetical protein